MSDSITREMSFNFGSWLRGVWGNNTNEPKLFIYSGDILFTREMSRWSGMVPREMSRWSGFVPREMPRWSDFGPSGDVGSD